VAALGQQEELRTQVRHALNCGVAPAEISEALLHGSVYSGIPGYRSAIQVIRRVFEERGIGEAGDVPPPQLPMTLSERELAAERVLGSIKLRRLAPRDDAPKITPLASGHLAILASQPLPAEEDLYARQLHQGYGAIWGRKLLDLRTRSFITVSLLQVLHEDDQLFIHVNNALNLGLSPDELEEAFAQAGLYGGTPSWHNATHVARDVFIKRGLQSPQ
jgi:4-carboxymuconolactone decarboxylase